MSKYQRIGLGGTFDHFHTGHQMFLLFAANLATELVIGVTTPDMIKEKTLVQLIEPYEDRVESVRNFARSLPRKNKIDIVPLTDPFGPTLRGSSVEALAVTQDTLQGAQALNTKRQELGLPELPVHIMPLVMAKDNMPISSQRIRLGQISKHGFVYQSVFNSTITLNHSQRKFFSQLQGRLVTHVSPSHYTIVVGDTSLQTFIEHKWSYDLGIVDLIKERKVYSPPVLTPTQITLTATNKAGDISSDMAQAVSKAIKDKHSHLLIQGEEDLAAVAAVLLAPLNTHIYYGQPRQGLVETVVTESLKHTFAQVLAAKD